MKIAIKFVLLVTIVGIAGCASTISVLPLSKTAVEESKESGIPYYLPRPYLLVTKNFNATKQTATKTKEEKKKGDETSTTTIEATSSEPALKNESDSYSVQVIYLPDLKRRYGLKIDKGTGTFDSTITLVDGWKLTGINVKSDSKTAEIISSVGGAAKDVGALIKAAPEVAERLVAEIAKQPNAQLWLYELGDDLQWKPVVQWPSQDSQAN